ncbi:hypothetical protein CPAST_c05240 [Clostridium pasteurianum DSM 525 = ATCC 6013]|uniref:Uncharacterized protein n=1 Tax=Clostridium pasteurianum DSM 525 = ATCC 6013 TaxID=1262449 RepID=A0A0H3IZZ6_CLOPA|nr:hypothetical protein [Clostridium pasteurianum]AJA46624.1 hypothetical protein CPAST_c05240 [Clostridium pasteurianum DSM 525 = ATCC 6013]AJA50612.1 hypothetical protein CLPA_c05240 [Clostridium pasteurianum DSM 525 = ATCC 6013]AOZ74037.1 hypothetical protein AQ983_02510 [Clostridium pasteurianum DSM 525 = ATCC 6013]AOZ77834.1 hypothetical protein AQ984_02510 [Clostridium pasteurianum]ELP61190.1 hypothetical protein F502_02005 [Clostridium pasteurianum DSM 525 = ATCC 6013]
MKFRKKTVMSISFALGTLMFASTAMAEVTTKSGYDQLKDSAKYTAKQTTSGLSNYTLDTSMSIKTGDTVIYQSNNTTKYDLKNKSMENTTGYYDGKDKYTSYNYSDENTIISTNIKGSQDSYLVTNYTNGNKNISLPKNPFEEDKTADIEKIADALVGNLKDAIVVNVKQDGSKELSSTINNTQIPSIVNALASFQFKNSYGNQQGTRFTKMPKLTKDIFIKDAKGNVITDKNGLIKTVVTSGVLSGKDKNNTIHNLTFQVSLGISNINSTKVSKPDLTGKKVQESTQTSYDYNKLTNPEKYIGKYISNIVEEKDGKFVKIGEATINIEKINAETVTGSYETKYIPEYEKRNEKFSFTGKFHKEKNYSPFDAELSLNNSNKKDLEAHLYLNPESPSINFYINNQNSTGFDPIYNKIFD